jgi:mannose-1-phosphate guanylyltransferase
MDRQRLVVAIMAGGGGTRLWPRSRRIEPKQFVAPHAGGDSLLRLTVRRLEGLVPPERILVICGQGHVDLAREHSGLPAEAVIAEPEGRDTAACIGFGARHALRLGDDAVLVVLPADHLIEPREEFQATLLRAAALAAERGVVATIGLPPTHPATGYGYIDRGEPLDDRTPAAFAVRSFKEKPDPDTAREYLARGHYLWNSGIFAFEARTILAAIARHLPDLSEGLMSMADVTDPAEVARVYPTLPRISIDYGLMEKVDDAVVVAAGFSWDDVGSFESLGRYAERRGDRNLSRGEAEFIEASGCLVDNDAPGLVVVSGLEDVLVVRTRDAVLVLPRSQSEMVKKIVEELGQRGRDDHL